VIALAVGALAVLVAAAPAAAVVRPAGLGDVVEVRHWSYPAYTRVVVELSRAAEPLVGELPPDAVAGRPARLYLDLPSIWAGRRYRRPIRIADGLLRQVRIGQNTLDTTRVVLDLGRAGRYRILHLAAPERIVVDVFAPDERSSPDADRSLPMDLRPVHVVVVDAGHGGRDPGAIGVRGLREKDVTLGIARALGRCLAERGFRVVYTRRRDRTLSLEERTAIAEGAGGDVFVSIHANASPRREASGIELFTLEQHAERQTLRLAARENGVAPSDVDPLQRLLARLRISEAGARSASLASSVLDEVASGMGVRWPSTREPVLKHGPFYVLYLSDMPSLLVEAGFVTHRQDARQLRDPDYQAALASEIADGIERFRDANGPVVAEHGE
jgi:N-acetylmuramoyl-L-alanine amidase